jgi:hypothetical protein
MAPERWQEVKNVLYAALDLKPDERPGYLERACAGDDSLRHEVESLLHSDDDIRSSFLQSPALAGPLTTAIDSIEYPLTAKILRTYGALAPRSSNVWMLENL